MSTQVTTYNANMPANLAELFGAVEPVLAPVSKVNSLKIAGKVFKVVVDGQTTELTMDVGGEKVPAPLVKTVLLNVGNLRQRSRTYFPGGFVEGENKSPVCWSDDSETHHADVKEPISAKCKGCPMSLKGSAHDEQGNETVACKQGKTIALIPSNKPDFAALQLRMAVTSLWQAPENAVNDEKDGWRSFDAYLKHLAANGVNNPAMVVTSIKFAASSNYPRLIFKSEVKNDQGQAQFEYITREMAQAIIPRLNSDEVLKIVGSQVKTGEVPKQISATSQVKPAPVQAAQVAVAQVEAPKPVEVAVEQPKPAPVVQEVVKPVEVVQEIVAQPETVVAPAPKAVKAEKPKVTVVENDIDLNSVLSGWD